MHLNINVAGTHTKFEECVKAQNPGLVLSIFREILW